MSKMPSMDVHRITFRAKTTWMKLEDAILPCTSVQSTRQVYITNTVPYIH